MFASVSFVTYLCARPAAPYVIALALMLGPLHIFAMWAGGRVFHLASAETYRRVAYAIIALAALASMPLFDRLLR